MWKNVVSLRFLPVFTFIWLLITFLISYAIAASLEHVYPVWPYISDTGTIPPESCIFGQMLNIGALLMAAIFYCRYRQVKLVLGENGGPLRILNILCLLAGLVAAFGASMVANFQETSDLTVHLFGANLIFGVGCGYFVLQTLLSFILRDDKVSRILNVFRSGLCILHIVFFVCTLVFAQISLKNFAGGTRAALHFNPHDADYVYRLASTFSEWGLAICLGIYLVTFSYEFKHLKFNLSFKDGNPRGSKSTRMA